MPAFTAYISSTLSDLEDERKAVIDVLSDIGAAVKQSYAANESSLIESCLDDVASCDVYFGIIGLRYGYVPDGEVDNPDGLSITELEYRHAAGKIPRYVFVKDVNEIKAPQMDAFTGEHPPTRVNAFRERIGSGQDLRPAQFETIWELREEVLKAFKEFEAKRREQPDAGGPTSGGRDGSPPAPAPPSAGLFVGRAHSIVALERLAKEEAARPTGQRLIGLVGMGGVGKTSLARELMRRIGSRYARTIRLSRPSEGHPKKAVSVFRDWAQDMRLAVDKEYAPAEIRRHLAAHYESLLVLIDDAWMGDIGELDLINEALPANATRLLTTRDKNVCTKLSARVYVVRPLGDNDAMQLIREQLLAAFGDVSAAGAAGVEAAIAKHQDALELFVKKVGGHPLALRLGIGSCNSLPEIDDEVTRLVASLDRGVDRFQNAALESADRNWSLAVSLSLSYDDAIRDGHRVGVDAASRFRALGILPEGCAVDETFLLSVWGDLPPNDYDGVEAKRALVDRHLLAVDVDTGMYSVQSVLRAFALALLREDPAQLQAVRRRYHQVVVERAIESHGVGPTRWSATDYLYPHLAHALPELIASLERTTATAFRALAATQPPPREPIERLQHEAREDVELGKGLAEAFRHAANRRPEWGETGLQLLELGLVCARAVDDHGLEAEFLGRLGDRYSTQQSARAEEYFAAALAVARAHGAPALRDILTFYAESRRTETDWDGTLAFAREALNLHAAANDDLRVAKTRSIIGEVLWRMSKLDEAEAEYRQALEFYRRRQNEQGEADVLSLLAANEFNRGARYEQALVLFDQALAKHDSLNDLAMKAQDFNDMGACHRYLGHYEQAEELFKQSLDLHRLIGNRRQQALSTCNLAGVLVAQEQYDLAQQRAEEGRVIGEEVGDKVPQLWGLVWEGLALQGMHELAAAERSLRGSVEIGRAMNNPRGLAGALGRLGLLLAATADRAVEGRALMTEALGLLRDHDLAAAFSNLSVDELSDALAQ